MQDVQYSPLRERIRRIRHLIRKEFIQIRRNKQNRRLVVLAPILQLLVFGFASRLDVRDVTMVVADMDRSALEQAGDRRVFPIRVFPDRGSGGICTTRWTGSCLPATRPWHS